MKILESQPDRYDRGIRYLSGGRSERVKRRIADEQTDAGAKVLEIGCGTGTLAVMAARRGAEVLGLDISPGMLAVAQRKVAAAGLEGQIELRRSGLAGMEELPAGGFDVVVATLVFSELSRTEQEYALAEAHRVLKPGGRLVLADEAVPRSAAKRLLHQLIRLPLVVLTFVLTQTTTRAVLGLEERVRAAGFQIDTLERTALDSFLYLVALKEGE